MGCRLRVSGAARLPRRGRKTAFHTAGALSTPGSPVAHEGCPPSITVASRWAGMGGGGSLAQKPPGGDGGSREGAGEDTRYTLAWTQQACAPHAGVHARPSTQELTRGRADPDTEDESPSPRCAAHLARLWSCRRYTVAKRARTIGAPPAKLLTRARSASPPPMNPSNSLSPRAQALSSLLYT